MNETWLPLLAQPQTVPNLQTGSGLSDQLLLGFVSHGPDQTPVHTKGLVGGGEDSWRVEVTEEAVASFVLDGHLDSLNAVTEGIHTSLSFVHLGPHRGS
jgi:hypothetical protein